MLIRFPNGYLEIGRLYGFCGWGVELVWSHIDGPVAEGSSIYRRYMGLGICDEALQDGWYYFVHREYPHDDMGINSERWTGRKWRFVWPRHAIMRWSF